MELHIAGQLRRTAMVFQPLAPHARPSASPVPRIRPRGQGLVVQAGTVEPSHRDEPSDRRGPLWWDAGVLHLAGNQFAHRHGQIQAPIADDARGPEEQGLQFHQLWLSPIETPEGGARALDEVRRDDGLRPGVERSSVEQESQRSKIGSAVPLGACKRHCDSRSAPAPLPCRARGGTWLATES
jgi:hypothetical protein